MGLEFFSLLCGDLFGQGSGRGLCLSLSKTKTTKKNGGLFKNTIVTGSHSHLDTTDLQGHGISA
jgi:hypothetical protein